MIELEEHISLLHEYNDVKDVAQMLLGKLGESQGIGRWLLPSLGVLDFTFWSSNLPLPTVALLEATLLLEYSSHFSHHPLLSLGAL